MTSKIDQLARSLAAGRTVTRANALVALKISNLSAEVSTLRNRGYDIRTVIVPDDGSGSRYTNTRSR